MKKQMTSLESPEIPVFQQGEAIPEGVSTYFQLIEDSGCVFPAYRIVKDGKHLFYVPEDRSGLVSYAEEAYLNSEMGLDECLETCASVASVWATSPKDALEQYGKTLPFGLMAVDRYRGSIRIYQKNEESGCVILRIYENHIVTPDAANDSYEGTKVLDQYIAILQQVRAYIADPEGAGVIAQMLRKWDLDQL